MRFKLVDDVHFFLVLSVFGGFATPVVNCGTAHVPMGLPMYVRFTHTVQVLKAGQGPSGQIPELVHGTWYMHIVLTRDCRQTP